MNDTKNENKTYIVHHCKNTKLAEFIYTKDENGKIISKVKNTEYCNNCFIDVDKTKATTIPPRWKYCEECVAKGYKNPKTRKSSKTPEQIEEFTQRMAEARRLKKESNPTHQITKGKSNDQTL